MTYAGHMTKIRTTLVLEDAVVRKLKKESGGRFSELANRILKKELFIGKKSMFGALKGLVSTKDIREEEAHGDLYH